MSTFEVEVEVAVTAAALEVRGLHAHYGRIEVLHGIDMTVPEGQLVSLVGANGAGKTTLLRTLSGVHPASGGDIAMFGTRIAGRTADWRVRAGMCQVPEGRQVFGPMSVEDNLTLGAFTQEASWVPQGLEEMYALFPVLREKSRLAAGTLSGGQQQMLAMARALMGRPKLLLLDEPSMGLAPLLVQEVFDVIRRLKASGRTILLVEQNARAALALSDRAYVMETGRIVLSGTGTELLSNSQVQSAYLGM
jgi:branched-chain amino acid transport system ATP-binding protein